MLLQARLAALQAESRLHVAGGGGGGASRVHGHGDGSDAHVYAGQHRDPYAGDVARGSLLVLAVNMVV